MEWPLTSSHTSNRKCVQQVVLHTTPQQHRALKYKSNLFVGYLIQAIEMYAAFVRLDQVCKQSQNQTFSCTVGAHDRSDSCPVNAQIQIAENTVFAK